MARVARLLALAYDINARVQAGEFRDYAEVARHHGLTRARLTQVMNLLLLAAAIQSLVLGLRFPAGHEPVTEAHLRQVLLSQLWAERREAWWRLRSQGHFVRLCLGEFLYCPRMSTVIASALA